MPPTPTHEVSQSCQEMTISSSRRSSMGEHVVVPRRTDAARNALTLDSTKADDESGFDTEHMQPTPQVSSKTIAPRPSTESSHIEPVVKASPRTLLANQETGDKEVPFVPKVPEKYGQQESEIEAIHTTPQAASLLRVTFDDILLTPAVLRHSYLGRGTEEDPYICEFIPNDPRNPLEWSTCRKWVVAIGASIATFVVTFCSSAYSSVTREIMREFDQSTIVVTLGLSLFVLGFAVGPVLFAPMSELYGRRLLNIVLFAALTAFNAGTAGANSITSLLVCRALGGIAGSGPMTNASGILADAFTAEQRGLAMAVFSGAVFVGPTLGPVVGSFVGERAGWRWVMGMMTIASGVVWIWSVVAIPETYSPVILERRAKALEKKTGKFFRTRLQIGGRRPSPTQAFRIALSRPWVMLFREPIVTLLSLYVAIIYGTLYLLFGAMPIVYSINRGWSIGIGSLSFLGVAIGMVAAVMYTVWDNSHRYIKLSRAAVEHREIGAAPEDRLPPAIIGSICLPVGLFWFSWTNGASIHRIVSIIATVPFGFGMTLVFLAVANYLIDSYVIYAASVMAANSIVRSLFGAAFPLFTPYMYQKLGIHWASSVAAFLALACMPLPLLFYRYGAGIRAKCEYSREASETLAKMMGNPSK
ncbi:hypothetical protein VF21_09775 [Pseudogymnoascus sp. 05NY08]|nr:hypothetical protein VF21_09775 [Pseudogymnoascus sp. 05NY08]